MDNASAAETNLRWLLRPIDGLLTDPAMTDLYINGPGEGQCFVERGHGVERITLPYTFDDLRTRDQCRGADQAGYREDVRSFPLASRMTSRADRPSPAIADNQFAFSIRQPDGKAGHHLICEKTACSPAPPDGIVRRRRGVNACYHCIRRGVGSVSRTRGGRAAQHRVLRHGGSGKTHNLRAFTHAIPRGWRL